LALPLAENEFAHGTLHRQSYIRPGKIFTAHESLFTQVLGQLRPDKLDQVKETVIRIIQQEELNLDVLPHPAGAQGCSGAD
jgi:mRNA interferase MazF